MMTRRSSQGFTLFELVITIAILAIAVAGILVVYITTVRSSADPMQREQAVAIAESYLDEILPKRFNDPDGADGETNRSDFDDVDDYDQINGEVPTDMHGNAIAGLGAYSVDVVVSASSLNGLTGGTQSLRVDVIVSYGANAITISGYRTNY